MDLSRNTTLAILIVVIAIGVFYMIDPTFMGLLGRSEGFEGGDVTYTNAPPSMQGEHPEMFENPGAKDKKMIMNAMHNATPEGTTVSPMAPAAPAAHTPEDMPKGKKVTEGFMNLEPADMPFPSAERPGNCYPKNQLAPSELLPADANSKWAQVNPQGQGDIAGKNFLNAGALIGVNTVGSSLRNASWDLRSEVPNPQVQVSPWMNTTISADVYRRPMEIG